MWPLTPAGRQHLACRCRTCCLRADENPRPLRCLIFRGSIPTPCNRCVRFATTVASGHATLATKRTLLLTWAGLPPAGSRQLCLARSFDHLVGAGEEGWGNFEAQRLGGPEVGARLVLGCRRHRQG